MKKIWIDKARSFKEAEKFDQNYYFKMSSSERLETIQFLREAYFKMKKKRHEGRTRLRRALKII